MNVRLVAACLVAIPALASAAVVQSEGDRTLAREVAAAVSEYSRLTIFDHVTGHVEDGVVVLGGKVTTPDKKAALEERVARLGGLRELKSEVTVLPASADDDALRYRVSRAIYGNPSFWSYAAMPNPPIHILVENGHVTLTGVVSSHVERAMARSLARGQGERSLVSELRTAGK